MKVRNPVSLRGSQVATAAEVGCAKAAAEGWGVACGKTEDIFMLLRGSEFIKKEYAARVLGIVGCGFQSPGPACMNAEEISIVFLLLLETWRQLPAWMKSHRPLMWQ
jgi:hypothetical protein